MQARFNENECTFNMTDVQCVPLKTRIRHVQI